MKEKKELGEVGLQVEEMEEKIKVLREIKKGNELSMNKSKLADLKKRERELLEKRNSIFVIIENKKDSDARIKSQLQLIDKAIFYQIRATIINNEILRDLLAERDKIKGVLVKMEDEIPALKKKHEEAEDAVDDIEDAIEELEKMINGPKVKTSICSGFW